MLAWLIRLFVGLDARWLGCGPEPRQRIYFANHTSNLDGPAIWASLPKALRLKTRPVAAKDYWLGGPVRRFLANTCFHAVLIERKRVTAATNPMHDLEAAIEGGDSLIIFPEGMRQGNEDSPMLPFKPGLWHLAQRFPAVELIPVRLENLNRILPKGQFLVVPVMAAVSFGAPLLRIEGEDKPTFLTRARQAVIDLGEDLGAQRP